MTQAQHDDDIVDGTLASSGEYRVKRFDSLQANVRASERMGKCRATESFAVVSSMCMRYIMNKFHTSQLQSDNHLLVMLQYNGVPSSSCYLVLKLYLDVSIGVTKQNYDPSQVEKEIYMNDIALKQLGVVLTEEDSRVNIAQLVQYHELQCWQSVTLYPAGSSANLSNEFVSYCIHNYHFIENNSQVHLPASLFMNGFQTTNFHEYRVVCQPLHSSCTSTWGYVDPLITRVHVEPYVASLKSRQIDEQLTVIDQQEKSFESLVKYSLGKLSKNARNLEQFMAPPRSFLLHGPRGVGKSSMIERVASRIGVKVRKLAPSDIYARTYDGEQGLAHFAAEYQSAIEMKPVLFVIDELDILLPDNEIDKDKQLVDEFLSIMESVSAGVCVIGITSNIHLLDSYIRKKFNEEIFIDVPSNEERMELLKRHIQCLNNCDPELVSNIDQYLSIISSKCHGFVHADIRTIYNKLCEMEKQINLSDVLAVIREHKPYSTKETAFSMVLPETPQVRWSDIGGLYDIKQKLEEMIVWPMKYKSAYERMSIKPPTGLLLYGPPGTGKTMIAKAVATAANANFISINIPDLIKSEIGESEKTLARIFRRAKLASPCVIFFDEIQAMFGDRREVTKDQQKLISQLLLELDGLEETDIYAKNPTSVILIAATNVPQNIDPSILRPGRIEHILYVGAPDSDARRSIFEMTLSKMKVSDEVLPKVPLFVEKTDEYYTGADIVNICQQAGLNALCESLKATEIEVKHFEEAFQAIRPSVTPQLIQFFAEWKGTKL